MTDLGLMLAGLGRKPLRTGLLAFAIFVAFLIYSVLGAFRVSLETAGSAGSENRLAVSNRINFTEPLPLAYLSRIRQIEGVKDVSYSMWFGGYFQEPRNFLLTFAVEPDSYTRIYSDLNIPPDQREAFVSGRDSVLVGRQTAEQYGWTLGQQIPLSSNIWRRRDGSNTWPVVVRAIYDGSETQGAAAVFLNYEYFDEARAFANDTVGNFNVQTVGPAANDSVIRQIDAQFANSRAETETVTESAFQAAFIDQQGNLGLIIIGVTGAAFSTVLLIVGNAMVGAVRERTGEIAVMKTIGFSSGRIGRIVVGETLLLAFLGGGMGLFAGWAILTSGSEALSSFSPFFSTLRFSFDVLWPAIGFILVLGGVTGLVPAWSAMRVNVIAAFRRI
jgi:putative ABC transport system permease protein